MNWKNSGEPIVWIMNKTIKKGGKGGEPRKGKLHENALYAEQSKSATTCNGAHIALSKLQLTQCLQKSPGNMPSTVMQCQETPHYYRPTSRPR